MSMYFYLIIVLQGFCIYHCIANKNQYYWYLVILLLPAVGSILYLFSNVYQQRDIEKAQQEITQVIKPTKNIVDLKQKLNFAETFENRVALADAYLASEMFDKAETEYKVALVGTFENDFDVNSKLIETFYYSAQYDKVLSHIELLKNSSKFKRSRVSFLYALTLEQKGEVSEAEEYLVTFNAPYSRYNERMELANFYIRNGSSDKAKDILKEIEQESIGMSKTSYNQNKQYIIQAKEMLQTNNF